MLCFPLFARLMHRVHRPSRQTHELIDIVLSGCPHPLDKCAAIAVFDPQPLKNFGFYSQHALRHDKSTRRQRIEELLSTRLFRFHEEGGRRIRDVHDEERARPYRAQSADRRELGNTDVDGAAIQARQGAE